MPSLALFLYMRTQWVHGFSGPVGLNYAVLQHKMDRMKLEPEAYEIMESDIRIMEIAALNEMHKK